MKKVFQNSELAHVYAQQSQDSGRNANGSFYFRGKTLFSYGGHFPICKFVTNDRGDNALLFTERTYSNTTAKQIILTQNATNQYNKVYCNNPENTHADNFKAWENEAKRSTDKLAKAKKPIIYLNELGYISNKANVYASFFGIEIPQDLATVLSIKDKSEYLEYAEKQSILLAEKMRVQKLAEKKKFKEVSIYDHMVIKSEVNKNLSRYFLTNIKNNYFDAIILAVPHKKFLELGKNGLFKYLNKDGKIYDIKHVLKEDKRIFYL
jgi:hypothetical protein